MFSQSMLPFFLNRKKKVNVQNKIKNQWQENLEKNAGLVIQVMILRRTHGFHSNFNFF